MSEFRKVFSSETTVLLSVHAQTPEQVVRNVRIAKRKGADGVFLVNHAVMPKQLLSCLAAARKEFAHYWIGINFLDLEEKEAMYTLPADASGLWLDNLGVVENDDTSASAAAARYSYWKTSHSEQLLFGGVAFKGQRLVRDHAQVAKIAASVCDVVTTSGLTTGSPPTIEKIRDMRAALGPVVPLCVASGMTAQNVGPFKRLCDAFIVATSLTRAGIDGEFDPHKVEAFVKECRRPLGG